MAILRLLARVARGGRATARRRWAARLGALAAACLCLAVFAAAGLRLLPHPTLAERVSRSVAVTAADGTLLRLTLASDGQYRLWTPLDAISPLLIEATLLYEDRHFFRHPGVNPVAVARAALRTYGTGGRRIGGSTLTMQLARRLWSLSSRTVPGKLVQIARALQLEAQYSKRELLEAYLNLAPYGGNIEGAGTASAIYFRKPAAALTLGEALTLAVIPQSPTRRGGAALKGADDGLEAARSSLLATWTAHHAPATGRAAAAGDAPPLAWPRLRRPDDLPFAAPHFVDRVLAERRTEDGDVGRPGATDELRTSLDARLQRLVERHLRAYVARQRRTGVHNAAALLVDARTVAVRALVGSADFFDASISGQVNGTRARRSPGSTLKPFAYALGLDQGVIHPATMLRDVPTAFAAYSPENFDGKFAGPLSAQEALVRSRNVPALTVASRLARPSLYGLLRTAGVDLPFPEEHYGLGLVLGTGEVTMEELVALYAALANRGVARPMLWSSAQEQARARTLAATPAPQQEQAPDAVRLVSEESAFLILDMLADNPRPASRLAATTAQARPLRVSWKTGTSWGFRDAWTVGVFGPYVLAVWVGDFSGAGDPAFVGVRAAAPLFFELVDSIAAHQPDLDTRAAPPPRGLRRLEVCALSGGLPTAHCPNRRTSWFIPGRSPVEPCAIHRRVPLDARGARTCALGPPAVRDEVFEVWPSDLAALFTSAGLPRRPLPPAAPGCDDVEAPRGAAPRITSPLGGVTYTLRAGGDTVALQAVTDGDAGGVYWFADQAFLGRSSRGTPLFWKPPGAGAFTVRAVDDLGRADSRQVAVEVLR